MPARPSAKNGVRSRETTIGVQPVDAPVLKPYVSIAELAQLTPWTDQAIRTMISRGVFREGQHFFYVGRRPVFKWTAIVGFIEQSPPRDLVPHRRDQLKLWDEGGKSGDKPARSK
jgi:hypothetical protein